MHEEPVISINFVDGAVDVTKHSMLPALGCGGECVFVGRTRPEHHALHGELVELKYDCYQAMAATQLKQFANEAHARFNARAINICHSTGSVPVDAASVVIAVACNRRNDAFLACRFLIDSLKSQVPVWKQEVWTNGKTWSTDASLSLREHVNK